MGESITEGTILEWRKKVGDKIKKDEILLEIGTDKVDSEIPSSHSGTIVEILAGPNETLDVGACIARLDTAENVVVPESPGAKAPEKITKKVDAKPIPAPKQTKEKTRRFLTPVVLKIAKENEIDLEHIDQITGSGRGGRVTKKDILGLLESGEINKQIGSAAGSVQMPSLAGEEVEMDHVRKTIAKHMRNSLDTSAHVYIAAEVDMTRIMQYIDNNIDAFKKREGFSLTVTPFIMAAAVKALKAVPEMNASLDGTTIKYHKSINLGMAVAVDNGLLVPTIASSDELNFLGLCRKLKDIATRSRNKQITPDELQGSTFTLTNFGVFNVLIGFPIINQPNVGILGIGTIKKKPVVIESSDGDSIAIRNMGMLSLSFDHRLIDGAGGSRFIDLVRRNLEEVDLRELL